MIRLLNGLFGGRPEPLLPARPKIVDATAWKAQGNAALQKGDIAEATHCYEQGVLADPADATLRLNLGFVLLERGEFEPAAARLEQALALRRPDDGFEEEAHYLLARARAGLGRLAEALRSCEDALRIKPDFPEALQEGVRVLNLLQRNTEAVEWARRLLALRPSTDAQLLLARALESDRQLVEAIHVLASACASKPGHRDASFAYFGALFKARRFAEALAEAQRLLAVNGPDPGVLGNIAAAEGRLGRPSQALAALEEALRLDPGNRGLLVNRSAVLHLLGRPAEAAACAQEGLRLYPDDADLNWNLAVNLLLLGDFEAGWAAHEWRPGRIAGLPQPRWRGENLQGKTIILYGEQGFGDIIQFVRFIPQVARQARTVYLRMLRPLEPLRLNLPPNCVLVHQGSVVPATDYECPLMSLPFVLGITEASIPAQVPYVYPEAEAVDRWREQLPLSGFNVGIAWSGNPANLDDMNRSLPLASLLRAAVVGCNLVAVQPDVRENDRKTLAAHPEVFDAGGQLRNFADTAALFQALDLVLTVDTSVAHLAGALGRPVWILLPWVPDWRWMLERSDSPWYPTARLYRQPEAGDWNSVLMQVRQDLAALVARLG